MRTPSAMTMATRNLTILPPTGVDHGAGELAARLIELVGLLLDRLLVAAPHRFLQLIDFALNFLRCLVAYQVDFISQQLARVLEKSAPCRTWRG